MARKKVLFISGLPIDKGGIENSIMEIYRGIDREKLLIDFIVRKPNKGYYHSEIISYGGKIFNLFENTSHKGNSKWNLSMDIYSIFSIYEIIKKNGPYDAIHISQPILDGFYIIPSKILGIPVRIVHSNNTGIDDNKKLRLIMKITRKLRLYLCKKYATHIWGCSEAACKYAFGEKIVLDKRMEVIPNPININNFTKRKGAKIISCNELNINENNITFVNIGRYVPQKNQLFLLDCFYEMLKNRNNLNLILVGSGVLEDDIKNRINELKINNNVTMLKSTISIPLVLSASDYFILPSIYEGFGIVLIESQAAGLPCFVSSVCQPEANLGLVDYIPLNKGKVYWANYIIDKIKKDNHKKVDLDKLMEYDTLKVALKMQKVYISGVKYTDA